jgi:hypothetical protein
MITFADGSLFVAGVLVFTWLMTLGAQVAAWLSAPHERRGILVFNFLTAASVLVAWGAK